MASPQKIVSCDTQRYSEHLQPRHRSASRKVHKRRPVRTTSRRGSMGDLLEGDAIHVYSRSAEKWVNGEVVKLLEGNLLRVEYEVGGELLGKLLHVHSDCLEILNKRSLCCGGASPSREVAEDLWQKGFTLRQLLCFFRDKVRPMGVSMTTEDVVRDIIIPETAQRSTCYMESDYMMQLGGPKKATVLVSHALKCTFSNTMLNIVIEASGMSRDELEQHLRKKLITYECMFDEVHNLAPNIENTLLEILSPGALDSTYWLCVLAINEHKALCGDCWTCRDKKGKQLTPNELRKLECDCGKRKRNPCACGTPKFERDDPNREVDKIVHLISYSEYAQEVLVSLDANLETLERIWVLKEINEASLGKQIRFRCISGLTNEIQSKLRLGLQVVTSVKQSQVTDEKEREAVLAKIPDTASFDSFVACMVEMNLGIFHHLNEVVGTSVNALQRLSKLELQCLVNIKTLKECGWENSWENIANIQHLHMTFAGSCNLVDISCLQSRLKEMKNLQQLHMNFGGCVQLSDVSSIGQGLKELKNLQQLHMDFGWCAQLSDVSSIGQGLKEMKNLQQLHMNFRGCVQLSDVSSIGQGLKEMKNLQQLHMDFCMASFYCAQLSDVSSIGQGLKELKNLQQLHMDFEGCGQLSDVSSIGQGLKELKNLQQLHMNFGWCGQLKRELQSRFSSLRQFLGAIL